MVYCKKKRTKIRLLCCHKMGKVIRIFWHRRDLRLNDNAALYQALRKGKELVPLFIFDHNILSRLSNKADARVSFIHQHLEKLKNDYEKLGCGMLVRTGKPLDVFAALCEEYAVTEVCSARDYEPYARERDKQVFEFLKSKNIPFTASKDHVIFEKNEILKEDRSPYTVFTPYSKKWKAALEEKGLPLHAVKDFLGSLGKIPKQHFPSLDELGFKKSSLAFPDSLIREELIDQYKKQRDYPALDATSHLSLHLRFGTISIRDLVRKSLDKDDAFLNELIWRDFYQMILFHFPQSVEKSFKPLYDNIEWRNNEEEFERWCEGKTGYPLVDAGMRELLTTGFMHNRLRMIVASFLCKHLLIDWRWGEAFFREKLLDYECASNVGGWQWAAGSGNDAAPYFRIFNPQSQQEKFDPEMKYIRRWIPEFGSKDYPQPIVEHHFARERALYTYKKALGKHI